MNKTETFSKLIDQVIEVDFIYLLCWSIVVCFRFIYLKTDSLASKWVFLSGLSNVYNLWREPHCNYVITADHRISTNFLVNVLWTNKHPLNWFGPRLVLYHGNHVGKCSFTDFLCFVFFSFDSIWVHFFHF